MHTMPAECIMWRVTFLLSSSGRKTWQHSRTCYVKLSYVNIPSCKTHCCSCWTKQAALHVLLKIWLLKCFCSTIINSENKLEWFALQLALLPSWSVSELLQRLVPAAVQYQSLAAEPVPTWLILYIGHYPLPSLHRQESCLCISHCEHEWVHRKAWDTQAEPDDMSARSVHKYVYTDDDKRCAVEVARSCRCQR